MSDKRYYKPSLPAGLRDLIEELFNEFPEVASLFPGTSGRVNDFIVNAVRDKVLMYRELFKKE